MIHDLVKPLGLDEPYPIQTVLRKLADAADMLLIGNSSDHKGHEVTALCRDRARDLADRIDRYLAEGQGHD